jgi:PAS domain S-box-containing protein
MRAPTAAVEQLDAAVEAWGIGTYAWQHGSAEFSVSARCRELYACRGESLAGVQALWANLHPDDLPRTQQVFQSALNATSGGRVDFVHRVVGPDGALRWLQHRARTSFVEVDGELRPRETIGSVMDVTERTNIEQELRLAETRFEEAERAAQFGIFEHNHLEDPKAERVYWSPRQREILGVSQSEPGSASTLLARVHPDDIDGLHAAVARAHDPRGSGYYDVEHRYLHPRLGLRWLLTRCSTHFSDVAGQRVPVRTVGAMMDVTARRAAEQEREQRAQILDATSDFVAVVDPGGKLVYLNRAGRQFLGIGAGDDVAGRSLDGAYTAESLQRLVTEGLGEAAREGAWRTELEFQRHDGSRVPMSLVLLCHRGPDGQVELFSTIARDVSRERQLEENMRQAQKLEAVGRLAGGVAHDFNNILCAVLSFARVGAREVGIGGPGYQELLEIVGAAERAAALTQQLLAFSRRQVVRPRVVDVAEVLTRLAPMIGRLVGEQIEVTLTLASERVRVKVDPTHLEQVLLNLAINARDAMEGGGHLAIECRALEVAEGLSASHGELMPGRYAVISVSDDGVGMDAATRERIFEPFFTTKGPGRGTGLGLATVFGIVKQSGGAMYVHSEPGRGSVFEAYVPSTEEPLTQSAPAPEASATPGTGVILLAEDDPSVRKVVVAVLQRAGYSVLAAPGPKEALRLAGEHVGAIDLMITDVVMPVMSGKALAQTLTQRRPNLAVLYMSGYTDEAIVKDGVLDAGVHLLPKPFTPERLLEAVGQALGARRGERRFSARSA